ncbi:unnamed protein product [Didymodactylos carnosus]|uniref:Uncharacterized protein n=1 Tax=Didymodactylos carnosus TaxID=1234261 RepID=A0A815QXB6_9BILA|nr:unnamed protein product [Didymodactylos carnosus]CAF1468197.1 unnamed protein product [Didymodactylos carnosus]CAF3955633.1 unnamed protein product [Didymodactylos carnosus]CAF4336785.1 unnamed protein product [Didymodactylos carnosus]
MLPQNPRSLAIILLKRGSAYTVLEQYDLARIHYKQALKIQLTTVPSYHPIIAATYTDIAKVHEHKGCPTSP